MFYLIAYLHETIKTIYRYRNLLIYPIRRFKSLILISKVLNSFLKL